MIEKKDEQKPGEIEISKDDLKKVSGGRKDSLRADMVTCCSYNKNSVSAADV